MINALRHASPPPRSSAAVWLGFDDLKIVVLNVARRAAAFGTGAGADTGTQRNGSAGAPQGKKSRRAAVGMATMRRASVEFSQADTNGDGVLSFDEFCHMVRLLDKAEVDRSDETLSSWFKAIDVDGSGSISMDEFFLYSLQLALHACHLAI